MSGIQPTIVVVHGAWSKPQMFHKLVASLHRAKFTDVHVPELPSSNGARPPPGFTEDVETVRRTLDRLVNIEKKAVILLMHSYGGAVGTEAATGFTRPAIQKAQPQLSDSRGVVAMVYLAGYILDAGWSAMTVVEKARYLDLLPQYIDVEEDGTSSYKDVTTILYHDLEPADQEEQTRLAVPWNMHACQGVVTNASWREVPTWYVRTTEDRGVPIVYQDIMLRQAETKAGDDGDTGGGQVNVVSWECGHSVYVSRPEQCVKVVREALAHVRSQK